MTKNTNNRQSITSIVTIFIGAFIGAALYLFYPVLECIHNFGGYAEDCDDGLSLFLVPFTIFFVAWSATFIIVISVALSKQKK
ncbi:hypothetical protein [Paraburkholderia hiiakae]|uniref:hypothetical protein n=1 Tax=Paraburkholderia hiiakae TaxID=1081782 RepID=UPI00191A0C11|nr:hypothetical protein [Paraburkholderia hiiakae]